MQIEIGSFSIGVVLGMVIGGSIVALVNHFLAKSRDAQTRLIKDFNEAADALAEILTKEKETPHPNSSIDFFHFRRVLNKRTLRGFNRCVAKYEKAKNDSPISYSQDYGDVFIIGAHYDDIHPIVDAIDELLAFTKRK